MPRPPSNIDKFRDEVTNLYEARTSVANILRVITQQGCKCTQRTLERRIHSWGLGGLRSGLVHSDNVLSRIQYLFFHRGWDDQSIQTDLASAGVPITLRTLKNIRLQHGMKRRCRTDEERNRNVQRGAEWLEQYLERSTAVRVFDRARTQPGNASNPGVTGQALG
ncbi:hypothetical protein F4803DRAFT_115261 [Xylaria telfairii]|nr:hypothetical protein F4803DRAFT_115261 [Xylaria telfairii]